MGILEFLVHLYPINTAWVVFSSDLKMDPVNLYPKLEGELGPISSRGGWKVVRGVS